MLGMESNTGFQRGVINEFCRFNTEDDGRARKTKQVPDMSPLYEAYTALVKAGFDEEQAMELLINLSVAVITRGTE